MSPDQEDEEDDDEDEDEDKDEGRSRPGGLVTLSGSSLGQKRVMELPTTKADSLVSGLEQRIIKLSPAQGGSGDLGGSGQGPLGLIKLSPTKGGVSGQIKKLAGM